jgi:chemosensory pili system protein ChpC
MSVAEAKPASEYPQEVSCLLIPMVERPMLLPNVSVAEIITGKVSPNPRTPSWHLGTLNWRSVLIPVVSFELLNDEAPAIKSKSLRLAIINSYRGDDRLPFYAISVNGIPGLVRIMPNAIDILNEQTLPGECMRVNASGQEAVVPNLSWIEDRIMNVN